MRAIVREFSPAEFWSGAGAGKTGRFEDLEEALARRKFHGDRITAGEPCRAIEA